VDQSEALLAEAEKNRGELSTERLRYFRHDLREPLTEGGFDAAFNVFSSIGVVFGYIPARVRRDSTQSKH